MSGPGAFEQWVNRSGYTGVFVAMLAGNLGIPALGSAGMIFVLRFLVSPQWWIAAAVATAGETTGQFVQYSAARFGAAAALARFGLKAEQRERNRFEEFYRRYGSAAVFMCRFVPGLKSVSGFPAGLARMPVAPFLSYTLLGASVCWLAISWALHSAGGRSPRFADAVRHYGPPIFLVLVMVGVLAAVLRQALRRIRRET